MSKPSQSAFNANSYDNDTEQLVKGQQWQTQNQTVNVNNDKNNSNKGSIEALGNGQSQDQNQNENINALSDSQKGTSSNVISQFAAKKAIIQTGENNNVLSGNASLSSPVPSESNFDSGSAIQSKPNYETTKNINYAGNSSKSNGNATGMPNTGNYEDLALGAGIASIGALTTLLAKTKKKKDN